MHQKFSKSDGFNLNLRPGPTENVKLFNGNCILKGSKYPYTSHYLLILHKICGFFNERNYCITRQVYV